jgi:serine/threonine protein kinase
MERLTHSPYVIRVFGFCGLTVVQEFAGRQLSSVVDAPKVSYIEKLILAKQIAQGLADIHAIPGDDGKIIRPTLVHNDINPANLLFTADGRPVLNDFNIAVLLMKHNETGETCRFYSRFPNPQWKAPEEQVNNDDENTERNPPIVNEKIDIYALGNVFYRIVAGRSPWVRPNKMKFNRDDSGIISKSKRQSGLMPPLPDTIKQAVIHTKNPALIALLDAMRRCYSFDPKDRPSAAEIVEFFDGVIQTMQIHSK